MYKRYLVFKLVRGLAKPWLVFSPSMRKHPSSYAWELGYATAAEAWSRVLNGTSAEGAD